MTLQARPQQAGVYRGQVTVLTNVNDLTFPVSAQSAEYVLPARDELILDELLPDHPDLDRPASEAMLEAHLTRLHFERLPGASLFEGACTASRAAPRNGGWGGRAE
ncbi:hypothetical protein ACFSC4_15635 [Deinococcus malanensis]|uniref:hypothetical protein n=1 Tax=Deinococcus malanensis TaxID=1706855 RepID=UPI003632A92D